MSQERRQQAGMRPGMRGGPVEKPKNFKETWGKLIKYCKSYVPIAFVAIILAGVGTLLQTLGPNQLGNMANVIAVGLPDAVDGSIGAIDFDAVGRIGLLLVGFYLTALILNFFQGFIMASITQRISQKMRTEISQKINKLPLSYFDKTSHGDILSRVTNDVDTIGQTMNQSIGSLVTSLIMFLGSAIMMFYNSWILALVGISSSVVGFICMAKVMKKSQPHFVRQQKDLGVVNGHIEEMFSNQHIVKVYNGSNASRIIFEEINESLYASGWKSQFMSGLMMPLMMFIGNFGYVAVCVTGAILAMNGVIEFGVIVAFMIYIRLLTQPLSQIAQAAQNLQRTAAASERVFEFFDEYEMADETAVELRLKNVEGNIEFKNVKFGYEIDKPVIHNFTTKVRAGQKVAIVGPTGAGKTTIVNLLMRFYELNSGEILIDGIPTNKVRREDVHDQFCMVLQDTWLFEGSVRENIVYCKENITDEMVKIACKSVGLHHFIRSLPNGYDTILNDKVNLSGGQKQLITIARAMIQDAPMLILDEATSSVDTRTEYLIQKAMDNLTVGRTSFVIAHRLSTIKNADVILVMKEGDIVESGSHDELLEKDGFYAELYNSQFEDVG